jgi:hypothetical protein
MQYGGEDLALGLGQGIVQSKYSEAAARALAFSLCTGDTVQAAVFAAALESVVLVDEKQCTSVVQFLRGARPSTCALQQMVCHAWRAQRLLLNRASEMKKCVHGAVCVPHHLAFQTHFSAVIDVHLTKITITCTQMQ